MATTQVHPKSLFLANDEQPARLIAACKDHEGFLILEADSYIVRAHFSQQETREIILKFAAPIH
jgi:hypothetical protein